MPAFRPEPPAPSIAPGPRRLAGARGRDRPPRRPLRGRPDRAVADLRPEAHLRRAPGGRPGRRLRANTEVRGGAVTLEVPPAEIPYHLEPDPTIPVHVVYEDDDLLIVDKPSGLVVHPAPGHWRGTLVNALLARGDHYGGIAGVARPGIVHRLDRDTSGLLMVARNDAAQAGVMAQLKARRVRKTYLALVQGVGGGRRRTDRGADRPRPEAPHADGRRAGRAAVRHRLPRPRAVRRLDAAGARPRHRADAPDPRPPRGHRATRSRATRSTAPGRRARARTGWTRLFLHAWRLELVSPHDGEAHPGRGAAAGRARGGARGAARGGGVGGTPARREGWRDAMPEELLGAPGRAAGHHLGPVGRGQGHDHRRAGGAAPRARLPLRRDLHDAQPSGPARSTASPTTSSRREAFHALRDAGELLEANEVHGNWYGTPRREVARGPRGGPRRHPQDRRPGRPASSRSGSRTRCSSSSSRRRSRRCSSASARGPPRRPTSWRSASATRRSSWRARATTTTSWSTRPARSSGPPREIEEIIEQEKRRNGDRRIRIALTPRCRRLLDARRPGMPGATARSLVEVAVDAPGGPGAAHLHLRGPGRARAARARRGRARRVRARRGPGRRSAIVIGPGRRAGALASSGPSARPGPERRAAAAAACRSRCAGADRGRTTSRRPRWSSGRCCRRACSSGSSSSRR